MDTRGSPPFDLPVLLFPICSLEIDFMNSVFVVGVSWERNKPALTVKRKWIWNDYSPILGKYVDCAWMTNDRLNFTFLSLPIETSCTLWQSSRLGSISRRMATLDFNDCTRRESLSWPRIEQKKWSGVGMELYLTRKMFCPSFVSLFINYFPLFHESNKRKWSRGVWLISVWDQCI